MLVSSIIASTSSVELKNGKRLLRKLNRITPQDQMSISMQLEGILRTVYSLFDFDIGKGLLEHGILSYLLDWLVLLD
jgi:hypothetical protein